MLYVFKCMYADQVNLDKFIKKSDYHRILIALDEFQNLEKLILKNFY